jgi:serine/threonine-protein kinase RsbW
MWQVTDPGASDSFCILTTGTEAAVRAALAESRDKLAAMGISLDMLGAIELVLAEALNNVAEHAYAQMEAGALSIRVQRQDQALHIHLRDNGHPLPDGKLPDGHLPESNGPRDSLPEGGFGWFLIRNMTEFIEYHREGDQNHLHLIMCLDPGG